MDIKEIIKWFIPCFHILLAVFVKMDSKLTFVYLFLFLNLCPSFGAKVNIVKDVDLSNTFNVTKNVGLVSESLPKSNQSAVFEEKPAEDDTRSLEDTSVGRTFGRPFKKMMAGMLPLIFQVGAASTWAVVAALVGVKTLLVTLVILKILLVAGAAKFGALFASKSHHQPQPHGWQPHQKEIHLHIHNGQIGPPVGHEEHAQTWSRNALEPIGIKNPYSVALEPHGPQTISTPYGNYVKID